MLNDLQSEARKYRLKLNADKTKILFIDGEPSRFYAQLQQSRVEILGRGASERYMGRQFTVGHCHRMEVENRISAG